jgi:hypothetical protein
MSRTFVIRRLTAVIVLLAILGFALPATAAPGSHHSFRTTTVQAPSLFDQILAWLGLLGSPGTDALGRTDRSKATSLISPLWDGTTSQNTNSDGAQGMDPNGLH